MHKFTVSYRKTLDSISGEQECDCAFTPANTIIIVDFKICIEVNPPGKSLNFKIMEEHAQDKANLLVYSEIHIAVML